MTLYVFLLYRFLIIPQCSCQRIPSLTIRPEKAGASVSSRLSKTPSDLYRHTFKHFFHIPPRSHPDFLDVGKRCSFLALSDPKYSGKMRVLVDLLKIFHDEKAKVLLFSYSTTLLR